MNRERIAHFGLLALAAIAVLWYLLKRSGSAAAAVASGAPDAGIAGYPNVSVSGPAPVPLNLNEIPFNDGNVPPYLSYNVPAVAPDLAAVASGGATAGASASGSGSGCNCGTGCSTGTQPVNSKPVIAAPAISAAQKTVQSYAAKFMSAPVGPTLPSSPFVYSGTGVLIGYN